MDKKDLKKDLADIKAKIKANSTDAHFAETLIAELLSIKGQIDHEPTLVHLPLSDVEDSLDADTFNIYTIKTGEVVYRLKGGFTVVVGNRFSSLNETLRSFVLNKNEVDSLLDEEEKELYKNDLFASTMILNLPIISFSDLEYKYKIYSKIVDWLTELQDKLITNAELQDETPDANIVFEDVTKAIDELKSDIEEYEKEVE